MKPSQIQTLCKHRLRNLIQRSQTYWITYFNLESENKRFNKIRCFGEGADVLCVFARLKEEKFITHPIDHQRKTHLGNVVSNLLWFQRPSIWGWIGLEGAGSPRWACKSSASSPSGACTCERGSRFYASQLVPETWTIRTSLLTSSRDKTCIKT